MSLVLIDRTYEVAIMPGTSGASQLRLASIRDPHPSATPLSALMLRATTG